jgi:hypothetical protein
MKRKGKVIVAVLSVFVLVCAAVIYPAKPPYNGPAY